MVQVTLSFLCFLKPVFLPSYLQSQFRIFGGRFFFSNFSIISFRGGREEGEGKAAVPLIF